MSCISYYTATGDIQVLVPRIQNENWICTSTQSKTANSCENLWSQNQSHCNALLFTVLSHVHIILLHNGRLIVEAKVLSYFKYLISSSVLCITLFQIPHTTSVCQPTLDHTGNRYVTCYLMAFNGGTLAGKNKEKTHWSLKDSSKFPFISQVWSSHWHKGTEGYKLFTTTRI